MALIKCSECGNEFSDKAKACPSCGCPIEEIDRYAYMEFPDFPLVMKIGKNLQDSITCHVEKETNLWKCVEEGDVIVYICENGIRIDQGFTKKTAIHNKQIISVEATSVEEVKKKSVLGRAAVGTLILGPFGGIVGGLSGIGSKTKEKYVIIVNFFDIYSHKVQSLILTSKSSGAKFAERVMKRKDVGYKTTEECNFICNLKNEKGEFVKEKIEECRNKVPEKELVKQIMKYGRSQRWAETQLYGEQVAKINEQDRTVVSVIGYLILIGIIVAIFIFLSKSCEEAMM